MSTSIRTFIVASTGRQRIVRALLAAVACLYGWTSLFAPSVLAQDTATAEAKRLFTPADVHRLKDVGSLSISPDGEWVAYTVRTTDIEKDKRSSDLFMVNWDGTTRVQLTHTEDGSEGSPKWSPDGKYLGFIASRGGDDDSKDPKGKSQIWLLNRAGGEAQRLTELVGGVSSFEWSPDGQQIAIVSSDPDPDEVPASENESEAEESGASDDADEAKKAKKTKTKSPIVIDRYRFKQDRRGYVVDRYSRIHLFDMATKKATVLTTGPQDSSNPVWSPDGKTIAFTSKRPTEDQPDPDRNQNSDIFLIEAREGAEAKRLSTWEGSDSQPTWSPDGTHLAWVKGPTEKLDFYGGSQVAVLEMAGASKPTHPTEELDRSVSNLRWSLDGQTLHFGFEDDRERFAGTVPLRGGKIERRSLPGDLGKGVIRGFEVGQQGVAVLASFPNRPTEIYRLSDGLALTDHNRELRESIEWASVRGLDTVAADGTRIGSMLLEPPGFENGKAYPTIAFIHGGPVGQDAFEFDSMAQAFAAAGYLVVQPNYRGSSGRGTDFSQTLYAKWADGVQDIHAVMDHLVEEGLADPKRLGIGGWSYGGINTNYAIASDTRWAAAVSGSGIANLLTGYGTDQYIWQYENEIGKPWIKKDLELYLELSYPFLHADRIKTPTLFMCGEKDFNVPLINSEQMYQALKSLGVPTRLVIYPGQYHGLSIPSYIQDRIERMIAWYDQHM